MGTVSETKSGQVCQRWDSQVPHKHQHYTTSDWFIDKQMPDNYCRNALNENIEPWCYTTDPNTRWGYCDVIKCEGKSFRFFHLGECSYVSMFGQIKYAYWFYNLTSSVQYHTVGLPNIWELHLFLTNKQTL